jgi:Ala-tRNA(Pro) deacylase
MPVRPVAEFLDQNQINYHCYNHAPTMTAMETAESAHIPGHQLAKTVVLKADGRHIMAVLPATERLDMDKLRDAVGARHIEMAPESEFNSLFPWCEIGGEPPLGTLYGMDVFMDSGLMTEDVIAFNAGTHTELVKMDMQSYRALQHPMVYPLAVAH